MSRSERERLADISAAIAQVREHLESAAGTGDDALLHDALLYQLVVIGEAVKSLGPATRAAEPDIPWSAVAGLRDMIAHEYFRIDTVLILQLVEREFPPLEAAVKRLLV